MNISLLKSCFKLMPEPENKANKTEMPDTFQLKMRN